MARMSRPSSSTRSSPARFAPTSFSPMAAGKSAPSIFPAISSASKPPDCHQLTAEAVVETKVVLLKRRSLDGLAAAECADRLQALDRRGRKPPFRRKRMLLLGRKTAQERVASFLVEMDDRCGGKGMIDLPMSRRDVADYLGLTLGDRFARDLADAQRAACSASPMPAMWN